jgi:hypothetical protein
MTSGFTLSFGKFWPALQRILILPRIARITRMIRMTKSRMMNDERMTKPRKREVAGLRLGWLIRGEARMMLHHDGWGSTRALRVAIGALADRRDDYAPVAAALRWESS